MTEVRVKPPNSVVLIGDPRGEPPASMGNGLIAATRSCVALGTLSEAEGATRIRLVDSSGDLPLQLAFEGALRTPNRILAVRNVLGETYLEMWVSKPATNIQIWVNDTSEPDDICILARGATRSSRSRRTGPG